MASPDEALGSPLAAPPEPLRPKHGALVVGGGPAGLATALALAKLRGWTGVTVVEKKQDLTWASPDLSYAYGLDARGLECVKLLGLEEKLREASVEFAKVETTFVERDGRVNVISRLARDPNRRTYLLLRPEFMKLMAAGVESYNAACEEEDAKIQVLTSSRVAKMERLADADGGRRLAVVVTDKEGGERVMYPSLVVGCDGLHSTVRATMQQWAKKEKEEQQKGGMGPEDTVGARGHTFDLKVYPSPAGGLRFKVLQLPPNPVTKNGVVLPNPTYRALRGLYKGWNLILVLFPVKDPNARCSGVIVNSPAHPLWEIPQGDVAAFRQCFREAWPQVDLNALVPDDVIKAFADSSGGRFPDPQASDGLAYIVRGSDKDKDDDVTKLGSSLLASSAVIILGDAAHCFPPDLGQGVNSALQDVCALFEHLEAHKDNVASSAEAFDRDRNPEADAIARLVQIGFPYQYQQSIWPARLFMAGFLLRKLLSSLTGGKLLAPPVVFMMQEKEQHKYSEVMRRNDVTRRRIKVGLVAAASVALIFLVRRMARKS